MVGVRKDVELDNSAKYSSKGDVVEHAVPAGMEDDSDVQQIESKRYDPAYDFQRC